MKNLILVMTMIAVVKAQATCLTKDVVLISTEATGVSSCQEMKPALKKAVKVYPHLPIGAASVQYWEGGYQKFVTVREKLLVHVTNWCTGHAGVVKNAFQTRRIPVEFSLENPNLNSQLEHSYEIYPLADNEVASQMAQLQQKCQSYDLQQAKLDFNSF